MRDRPAATTHSAGGGEGGGEGGGGEEGGTMLRECQPAPEGTSELHRGGLRLANSTKTIIFCET